MQAVSAELRGVAAAVAFLTRVPVGRRIRLDAADVGRGGAAFPLVGAGIGAAVGGLTALVHGPLTGPLAAVCGVATGLVLTGALHLDGLADTFDALGGWTRERALEIMRDHRIGTYGAAAVGIDLLAKTAALAALAPRDGAWLQVVAACAAARAVPVALSAALPYARTEGDGLGRVLGGKVRALVAVVLAAAICVALGAYVLAATAAAVALCAGLAARRWLGGVTGDVLGAAAELTEVAALVAAVAVT
jgi:adenosylcobinamide-GDP ribazoletransferase